VKFLRTNWFLFVLWIEVSLLAVTFIGDRPYLGLTTAVLGGVALGWVGIASAGEQAAQPKAGRGGSCTRPGRPQGIAPTTGFEHTLKKRGDTAAGFGVKARRAAEWIAAHELWFLALPIALLILPHRTAPWGLIAISLLWPIRWVARRRITVRTPVDVYVLGLLLMIPVALYASVDLARSRII
jgi:hypothetical protein